jgi:hypothetical protein
VRLPFDWETLLQPLSVILPPPGNSKPELFCLNLIKLSLLGWIAGDMASPDSRLLQRNPADRHRIVLAQDEGHNFLALEAPGFAGGMNDTRALAEQRQAGLVSILATQSPSRLNKTTKDKLDDFLGVNGNYFFLGVNGQEREKVLRIVGQVEVRRINRSYGRSENSEARTVGTRGDLRTPRIRANVNETVHREQTDFLSIERYGLFREGMAIHVAQGQRHRVVYCPPHTRLQLVVQPDGTQAWVMRPQTFENMQQLEEASYGVCPLRSNRH